MALSQIQCLDENNVNPRTHQSKVEFFYCEDQRLALEVLLRDGRDAFGKFLQARSLRGFLSDPELDTLTGAVEPYDPGLDLYPLDAEDDEPPLSLHYWPEVSDRTIPQLDLGWPDCASYRGVTRTTVYAQPPLEGQTHIKEIVRKTIAHAQKVIAVVMDMFTDVDIFRDLLDAGFKRRVSVYIMVERTSLPHFLSMIQRANMHAGHLKNLRVRCADGAEFYTRSSSRVRGRLGHRFMFIDGDKAVSGSYSYTWMSSRLDKHLVTVVTGQAVDAFDRLFRDLYVSSSAVDLRQVTTEPAPEPEPLPQHAPVAPLSAAMAKKLYNPKYALVTMCNRGSSPASSSSPKDSTTQDQTLQESRKRKRRRASVVEASPLHPGLVHLEKVYLIPYLPTWPEPDPASDVIGFINIRDASRPTQVHLQRSEMFETSQAIRFKSPLTMPEEAQPEVALPRQFTTKCEDPVADKLQTKQKEVNSKPEQVAPDKRQSTQIHNRPSNTEPKEQTAEQKACTPGTTAHNAGLKHVINHTSNPEPKTQTLEQSTHAHEIKHITAHTSATHTPKPEPKTETLNKEANAPTVNAEHNLTSNTPTRQNANRRTTPQLAACTPSSLALSNLNPESITPTHPAHIVTTNTPDLEPLPVSKERPTKQTTSTLNTHSPNTHGTPGPNPDPTGTSNPASAHVLASPNPHATHMMNQPHTEDRSQIHTEPHRKEQTAQTNVQLHVQAQRTRPQSPSKNIPSPSVPTVHNHVLPSSDSPVPSLSVPSTSSSGSTLVAVSSISTTRPAPVSSAPTASPAISSPSLPLVSPPATVLAHLIKPPPIPSSSPRLPPAILTSPITSPPLSSALNSSQPTPAPPVPKPCTVQLLIKGGGVNLVPPEVSVVKRPGGMTGTGPQADQTGPAIGPLVDREVTATEAQPGTDTVPRSEKETGAVPELQSRSGMKTGVQTDTVKNLGTLGEGCLTTQQMQYDYKRISAIQMATGTKLQAVDKNMLMANKPQTDNVIVKERTASERETKTVTLTDIQSTPKPQRDSVTMLLTHTEALTRAQIHSEPSEVPKRDRKNVTQPRTDIGATKETLGDYGSVLQSKNEGQPLTSSPLNSLSPEADPHTLTLSSTHTQRHTPVSSTITTKYKLDGTNPTPASDGSGIDLNSPTQQGQHTITSTHNSQGQPIHHTNNTANMPTHNTTHCTVRDYRKVKGGSKTLEKDLRLNIPDSATAHTPDLLSPTSDRDPWSPTPSLRTPTPDLRAPTPDSRTHTPDLRPYTPDRRTPTPDGYWSSREDSIVSTTSEEYYDCSESPFSAHDSVDVFDQVPSRVHWSTEENISNANTAATAAATATTITTTTTTTSTTTSTTHSTTHSNTGSTQIISSPATAAVSLLSTPQKKETIRHEGGTTNEGNGRQEDEGKENGTVEERRRSEGEPNLSSQGTEEGGRELFLETERINNHAKERKSGSESPLTAEKEGGALPQSPESKVDLGLASSAQSSESKVDLGLGPSPASTQSPESKVDLGLASLAQSSESKVDLGLGPSPASTQSPESKVDLGLAPSPLPQSSECKLDLGLVPSPASTQSPESKVDLGLAPSPLPQSSECKLDLGLVPIPASTQSPESKVDLGLVSSPASSPPYVLILSSQARMPTSATAQSTQSPVSAPTSTQAPNPVIEPSSATTPALPPSQVPTPATAPALPPSQASTPATTPALPPSQVPTPATAPALPPSQAPTPATTPALPPSQAPTPATTPALPPSQAPATTLALPPSQAPTPATTPALHPSQVPTPVTTPALPPSQAPIPATTPALHPSQAPTPVTTPALPPRQAPTPATTPALPPSQAPTPATTPALLPSRQAPIPATAPTQSFLPTPNRSSAKPPTPAFPHTTPSPTHRKVSPKPSPKLAQAQPLYMDGAQGKHAVHPREGQRAKKDDRMETYESLYGKKTVKAKGQVLCVMEEAEDRSEEIPIERPKPGELPTLGVRPRESFYRVLASEEVVMGEFKPVDFSTVEVKRVKLTGGENRPAALPSGAERAAETPALGPSDTERRDRPQAARETEAKKIPRTPPRLPRGQHQQQQQDGRLPSQARPTQPNRPPHAYPAPHPSGARARGSRPTNQGVSRSTLQALDNVSAARRPPVRQAPPAPGAGPIGAVGLGAGRRQSDSPSRHSSPDRQPPAATGRARAGQTQGQPPYPKPQASFLYTHANTQFQIHPQSQAAAQAAAQAQPSSRPGPEAGAGVGTGEAPGQELGQPSFGFSFGRLYNLKGLKERMSRPAPQTKKSNSNPATQGHKSTR